MGDNADVFRSQTAAFRALLPSSYNFHFVAADRRCEPAPGVADLHPGPYQCWYNSPSTDKVRKAHERIYAYIRQLGGVDIIMGFSQGASLAASFILHRQLKYPTEPPLFRAAIFICSPLPFSRDVTHGMDLRGYFGVTAPKPLSNGRPITVPKNLIPEPYFLQPDTEFDSDSGYSSQEDVSHNYNMFHPAVDKVRISIPTAHIYGREDAWRNHSLELLRFCNAPLSFQHDGGHEIPRSASDEICDLIEEVARVLDPFPTRDSESIAQFSKAIYTRSISVCTRNMKQLGTACVKLPLAKINQANPVMYSAAARVTTGYEKASMGVADIVIRLGFGLQHLQQEFSGALDHVDNIAQQTGRIELAIYSGSVAAPSSHPVVRSNDERTSVLEQDSSKKLFEKASSMSARIGISSHTPSSGRPRPFLTDIKSFSFNPTLLQTKVYRRACESLWRREITLNGEDIGENASVSMSSASSNNAIASQPGGSDRGTSDNTGGTYDTKFSSPEREKNIGLEVRKTTLTERREHESISMCPPQLVSEASMSGTIQVNTDSSDTYVTESTLATTVSSIVQSKEVCEQTSRSNSSLDKSVVVIVVEKFGSDHVKLLIHQVSRHCNVVQDSTSKVRDYVLLACGIDPTTYQGSLASCTIETYGYAVHKFPFTASFLRAALEKIEGRFYSSIEVHFSAPTCLNNDHNAAQTTESRHDEADTMLDKSLAATMKLLASPKTSGREYERLYGRYGDIKPDNILWSKDYNKTSTLGTLKISHFGFSRFHTSAKNSRVNEATRISCTPAYRAPKCVYLEFITWLLIGWTGVEVFRQGRRAHVKDNAFFIIDDGMFRINPSVAQQIEELRAKASSFEPPLRECLISFLVFMSSCLEVNADDRPPADALASQLKDLYRGWTRL
ncbi:hypothetical protein B7463_g7332, partial [Scytalidium lignicola]